VNWVEDYHDMEQKAKAPVDYLNLNKSS